MYKIKKLKGEYKKEKDRHNKTGEERTTWDYFDAMDSILGHRPATRPPIVIDTSRSRPVTPVTPVPSEGGEEVEDIEEEQSAGLNDSEAGSLNSSTRSLASTQPSSRKRKRSSKSDNVVVVNLMERVISAQRVTKEWLN